MTPLKPSMPSLNVLNKVLRTGLGWSVRQDWIIRAWLSGLVSLLALRVVF